MSSFLNRKPILRIKLPILLTFEQFISNGEGDIISFEDNLHNFFLSVIIEIEIQVFYLIQNLLVNFIILLFGDHKLITKFHINWNLGPHPRMCFDFRDGDSLSGVYL
jgi:hypothetical protein